MKTLLLPEEIEKNRFVCFVHRDQFTTHSRGVVTKKNKKIVFFFLLIIFPDSKIGRPGR